MTLPFAVTSQDITRLTDLQLTELLKLLLHAEADKHGIAQRGVEVALNIRVGDGGEDGRISWQEGPEQTDFLPNRLTQFQNKATSMGPADCAKEIITEHGGLKPLVSQVLAEGGDYVLFTTQELNTRQKQDRTQAIREMLLQLDAPNAERVGIHVYDASTIMGWANCFMSAIVSILNWVGRPLERGVKPFSVWAETPEFERYPFINAESRVAVIGSLRSVLSEPRNHARIVGLSGLGKTRTAFEVFNGDHSLQQKVVYIDAPTCPAVQGLVADWVTAGISGVLVVDNCDKHLHQQLQGEVSRTTSKLSLLTLDFNIERVASTNELKIAPLSDAEMVEMLTPYYGERIQDLDRVAAFAQGFPQMAVLIAEARLNESTDVGSLTDDSIAAKLLWGADQSPCAEDEKILRSCALFDRFGVDKEVSAEYEYISANIVNIDPDSFYDCVQRFSERGIIDRRGRYGQVVPKPLAIRLAGQWWKRTRPQIQTCLIETLPESMVESFCDQIEKLDFLPEVKTLTHELCGEKGPFGQAEVILSARGSRLFRSFVEVNPEATSAALNRILQPMTREELLDIAGSVRRNLVWSLEMLCFHRELFEEAAHSLSLLAISENEHFSNNALGIFSQLFRIRLSGTEAEPALRFALLDRLIHCEGRKYDPIALSALEMAIETRGGSRTRGPEHQGTKPPLEEWQPTLWQEVFDYWDTALELLCELAQRGEPNLSKVKGIVGNAIRGLVGRGRVESLDKALRELIGIGGIYWPEALDSIKTTIEYDSAQMPPEGLEYLQTWLSLLAPEDADLEHKLAIYVVKPPWETRRQDEGRIVDVAASKAEELGRGLANSVTDLIPYLPVLLQGEQRQGFSFGRALGYEVEDIEPLLELVMEELAETEQPNPVFLVGLLNGLFTRSHLRWDNFVVRIAQTTSWEQFYPDAIRSGEMQASHLALFMDLIKSGKLSAPRAASLSYGSVTAHLSPKEITDFCAELSGLSDEAAWTALDILFMYCHGDNAKFCQIQWAMKQIVTLVPLGKKSTRGHTDLHQWHSTVEKLCETEGSSFAQDVAQQIIYATTSKIDHGDIWHYIKPTLLRLFSLYGEQLWPLFADAIIKAKREQLWWLQQVMEKEGGLEGHQPSAFSLLPLHLVVDWCKQHRDLAPVFVARCIEVLEKHGEDGKQPTNLFFALLTEFGADERVQQELYANLGSKSYCGSIVPLLKEEKNVFDELKAHPNKYVRNWTRKHLTYLERAIESESMRDDEQGLGIY